MKNKSLSKNYPLWVALPTGLIYTIFTVAPLFMSGYLSLTDWNIDRLSTPVFKGLVNYQAILADHIFTTSLINTLIYAISTSFLKVFFGFILAILLVRATKKNNFLRTLYYMPCVLSTTLIGVLFHSILASNGMLNNMLSGVGLSFLTTDWLGSYGSAMGSIIAIQTWMWAGFNMFIMISGLQAIPDSYYEFAEMEGASNWVKMKNITIPYLVPAFTVNFTLNITGGLKVFDMVYVLTEGGPGFDTQVLSTYVYRDFGIGLLGESCAASIVLFLIVALLTYITNRYFTNREVEM
jgi:raffinose/stachyose/melibiose transport system permease protein